MLTALREPCQNISQSSENVPCKIAKTTDRSWTPIQQGFVPINSDLPAWKFLVILKTLISWFRALERNCSEQFPFRNWLWHTCLTWISNENCRSSRQGSITKWNGCIHPAISGNVLLSQNCI